MQKYTLTAPVVFRDGVFKLTKEQLERRVHQVSKLLDGEHKGLHVPTQPIQFKAGEVIEVVSLPKEYWASTKEGQAAIDKRLAEDTKPRGKKDPEGDDPPHETEEEKTARLKAEAEAAEKAKGGKK